MYFICIQYVCCFQFCIGFVFVFFVFIFLLGTSASLGGPTGFHCDRHFQHFYIGTVRSIKVLHIATQKMTSVFAGIYTCIYIYTDEYRIMYKHLCLIALV